MAVTRKQSDISKHYNPEQDFNNDQRHRFTEIANQAAERRAQKALLLRRLAGSQKTHVPAAKKWKKSFYGGLTRVLIWSLVLGLTWLWMIFMTSG
ncbi:hypothetical protein HC752_15270 [Vibrio sp. S9_S30]|uniref:hypothetical protein n=1 Tax=Vibrio sp. S9_S30 TaxID=2720226 RepID=UPI001681106B|nr:hypothetical protein [Vibrio sp. S9_S30]MBD1558297.1 hypothetical protein [Vibrio sp. S9_S30]